MQTRLSPRLTPIVLLVCGVVLSGCGGGSSPAISPRSDGKVALPAQTFTLTDTQGHVTARTLSTPPILASPGGSFDLLATLNDASGVAGLALRLEYDKAALACVGIGAGVLAGPTAQIAQCTSETSGIASFAAASTTGHGSGAAVLVTFHMRVLPSATPQNATVKWRGTIADDHGNTLGRIGAAGAAPLGPKQATGLIGDLMGDGQPEVGSAIKILRVVVGLDPQPAAADLWQWDCNSNGTIDVADAVAILRCVVGLDTWPIGGGTMTDAQRKAAMDAADAKLASLRSLSRPEQNRQLAAYLPTQAGFSSASTYGTSDGGGVVATFRDGEPYVIVNDGQEDQPVAPAASWARATIRPAAVRSGLPQAKQALLLRAMGTAFADVRGDLQSMLQDKGYTPQQMDGSVDNLKGIRGPGIFYFDTHGLYKANWKPGVDLAVAWTSTPVPDPEGGTYAAEQALPDPTIVKVSALDHYDPSHNPVMARHYGVTASFIKKNGVTFGTNSFVFMDCCFLDAALFKNTCIGAGASLYAGWTAETGGSDAARAARFTFDRMTGDNSGSIAPESPKQRPFDYARVLTDLQNRGWATSGAAQLVFTPGTNGDCGILAPSIRFLTVNEVKDQGKAEMTIDGMFGQDPGSSNRKVTIADTPVNVTSWSNEQIKCDLPTDGAGSVGDVVVSARDHKSNAVPLTEWIIPFHYTYAPADHGTWSFQLDMTFHIRADVHQFRDTPHLAPQPPPVVPFVSSQASNGHSTYSGTWTDSGGGTYSISGGGDMPSNLGFGTGQITGAGVLAFGSVDANAKTMRIYLWGTGPNLVITTDGTASPPTFWPLADLDPFSGIGGVYPPNNITLPYPYVDVKLDDKLAVTAGQGPGPQVSSNGDKATITWDAAFANDAPDPTMTPAQARRAAISGAKGPLAAILGALFGA